MNLKFVKNLTDASATMLLYNEIGGEKGIDGNAFAEEMYWLSKNVPLINLRINSPGGSIFEGYSIYSAMREVGIPVDTYNDFLAASMGGIIAQQGRKRYAADNSIIMLHPPMMEGEMTVKDKEILGLLKNSLIDAYTNRTGKEYKIISDLMDVETWVEARKVGGVSAMLEMGLADELYSSSVKVSSEAQVFNAKKLYSISNKMLINDEMENKELENKVAELSASIEALSASNAVIKAENDALKASLEEKDNLLKVESDKAAVEMIENGIVSGKIKAESKESWINHAKSAPAIVKALLDDMPTPSAARFSNVAGSAVKVESGKEDWTIRDYEEKDPKALGEILKNDPERYKEMYNSYYKK